MNETSEMAESQQYKLLSKGERAYIEMTEDKIREHYARPDLANRQFTTRIKYRAINAIKEIAWLCDKLPGDVLEKIFTDDHNIGLLKITEKALEIADSAWRKNLSKKLAETKPEDREAIVNEDLKRIRRIREHYQTIEKYVLQESEIYERNRLLQDYLSYASIKSEIEILENKLKDCQNSYNRATNYLKKKGLLEDFVSYKQKTIKEYAIESFKKEGRTMEDIDKIFAVIDESVNNTT